MRGESVDGEWETGRRMGERESRRTEGRERERRREGEKWEEGNREKEEDKEGKEKEEDEKKSLRMRTTVKLLLTIISTCIQRRGHHGIQHTDLECFKGNR